jgi:hypothetical protein
MIDPATGWFEIVKTTNKSATSIQDFFKTPDWHGICDLNLLSLTMGISGYSKVSSNKCIIKTIMALKPNQIQVTTQQQMQSLSEKEYTKLSIICSDHLTWKIIMNI